MSKDKEAAVKPEKTIEKVAVTRPTKVVPKNMDTVFTSHKRVLRFPMTRLEYNVYRDWELPKDENGDDAGYLVEYIDSEPNMDDHRGYVSWSPKEQFDKGYILEDVSVKNVSVSGSADLVAKVSDVEVFGDPNMWQLISKASSKQERWMKSTKAMMIAGVGCLVQVTTQQGEQVAEAIQFVPGVKIKQAAGTEKGCRLVKI